MRPLLIVFVILNLIALFFLCACNTYLGTQGATGLPGKDGSSCFVSSVPGGALVQCTDGTSSYIANGSDGQDGSDSNIQIVPFCTDVTAYPLVFSEVGFCINNEIYAVYSESNGFMVKTPPGAYHSQGHNSSCNFTVAANCVVNH